MNNTLGIPRVGITPYCRADGTRYLPAEYASAIEALGAEVVLVDYAYPLYSLKGLVISLDAMLFSGGGDIDPRHYGQRAAEQCAGICEARDQLELALFDLVWPRDIPILGICRGMQLINVAMGGTLRQHIAAHRAPAGEPPIQHEVQVLPGTRLNALLQSERILVNSTHHQAVEQLGQGLQASARAADGTIEGLELPGERLFLGVQWHPERMTSQEHAQKIFRALREAMH